MVSIIYSIIYPKQCGQMYYLPKIVWADAMPMRLLYLMPLNLEKLCFERCEKPMRAKVVSEITCYALDKPNANLKTPY